MHLEYFIYYAVAHRSENNLSPTSSNSSYTAHITKQEITHNAYGTYGLEYDGFPGCKKVLEDGKKFIPCNTLGRLTYSASKQHTIMPIFKSQPLCCLILLIPYPSNSKPFSPPQANVIALHYLQTRITFYPSTILLHLITHAPLIFQILCCFST